jgi:hypothetical protein
MTKYEILDSDGAVENTINADLSFVETHHAGKFREFIDLNATALAANSVRVQRDLLIAASDWTQCADISQATKDKWAPYRQALRDVPQQTGFPFEVIWPT